MFNNYNSSIYSNIITPLELKQKYLLPESFIFEIENYKKTIINIIKKKDKRKIIICGPCSIHDTTSIYEYAKKFSILSEKVKKHLFLILRVYLEKPRTSIGWKGFINDPELNNSCNLEKGLEESRKLLINLIKLGLPLATEILDLNIPRYLGDLFSWYAIGARNSESQLHRELVSDLNTPVGFKNSTDGSVKNAINSIISSSKPHTFLSINSTGKISICKSKGNVNTHIILRGGKNGPNYSFNDISEVLKLMHFMNINTTILIDCSHDNSNKNFKKQITVFNEVIKQFDKNNNIIGMMIESNIYEGNQPISNLPLKYGVSITDECINWENTEKLINNLFLFLDKK